MDIVKVSLGLTGRIVLESAWTYLLITVFFQGPNILPHIMRLNPFSIIVPQSQRPQIPLTHVYPRLANQSTLALSHYPLHRIAPQAAERL